MSGGESEPGEGGHGEDLVAGERGGCLDGGEDVAAGGCEVGLGALGEGGGGGEGEEG